MIIINIFIFSVFSEYILLAKMTLVIRYWYNCFYSHVTAIGYKLTANGYELTANGYELTTNGYELTANCYKLTANGYELTTNGYERFYSRHLHNHII